MAEPTFESLVEAEYRTMAQSIVDRYIGTIQTPLTANLLQQECLNIQTRLNKKFYPAEFEVMLFMAEHGDIRMGYRTKPSHVEESVTVPHITGFQRLLPR